MTFLERKTVTGWKNFFENGEHPMDITWRIGDLGSVVGTGASILRLNFKQS